MSAKSNSVLVIPWLFLAVGIMEVIFRLMKLAGYDVYLDKYRMVRIFLIFASFLMVFLILHVLYDGFYDGVAAFVGIFMGGLLVVMLWNGESYLEEENNQGDSSRSSENSYRP